MAGSEIAVSEMAGREMTTIHVAITEFSKLWDHLFIDCVAKIGSLLPNFRYRVLQGLVRIGL